MEYFGKYGYKDASTDDISARAEISKGLLFYVFHKKFLYGYCAELMLSYIHNRRIYEITVFKCYGFWRSIKDGNDCRLSLPYEFCHESLLFTKRSCE